MEIIKVIAKGIVEEKRTEEIKTMEELAKKCKKCFHYEYQDPSEVKWDHTFVAVGHVCNYGMRPSLRDLVPCKCDTRFVYNKESKREEDEDILVNKQTGEIIPVSLNNFTYWFQTEFGERTIKDRIKLGECEFREFPKPRKPWGERDFLWDIKFKDKFIELLKPNLIAQGFKESEIPQIIAEKFGKA